MKCAVSLSAADDLLNKCCNLAFISLNVMLFISLSSLGSNKKFLL